MSRTTTVITELELLPGEGIKRARQFNVFHNGDGSGDCRIVDVDKCDTVAELPCSLLLKFAAEYARMKRIEKAESADWRELLS